MTSDQGKQGEAGRIHIALGRYPHSHGRGGRKGLLPDTEGLLAVGLRGVGRMLAELVPVEVPRGTRDKQSSAAAARTLPPGLNITAGFQGKEQLPSLLMFLGKTAGAVKASPALGWVLVCVPVQWRSS